MTTQHQEAMKVPESGYFRRDRADCGHIPDGKFRLRKRKTNVASWWL